MGKFIGIILTIFKILKSFGPLFAFLYLGIWAIRFYDEEIYKTLDSFFGFIPSLIDKVYKIEADIMGADVSMSYVVFAAFLCVLVLIAYKYEYKLYKRKKYLESEEMRERVHMQKIVNENVKRKELKLQKIASLDGFYGLFELNLQYHSTYNKDLKKLEQLKRQLYIMIFQKLKEKYIEINFEIRESIFFSCYNFSKLHFIIQDIAKIFRSLKETNAKKGIKIELTLSFWGTNKESDVEETYIILKNINKLGYKNKIILSSGVYYKYQGQEEKCLEFAALGITKLLSVFGVNSDLDVNLFSVTSVK